MTWAKQVPGTTSWGKQSPTSPVWDLQQLLNYLLNEDGSKLLQEDSYPILLESSLLPDWLKKAIGSASWDKEIPTTPIWTKD